MSRRYGRNQKRRARAEIAQLEQKAMELRAGMAMDRALLQSQGAKITAQDAQLKFVAEVLGTNFIGLEPALWKFSDKHRAHSFRCPVQGGDVLMHSMQTNVTDGRDRPDFMTHLHVEVAGQYVGYAISEYALFNAPVEYVVRCVSEEMARMLIEELRKKRGRSMR